MIAVGISSAPGAVFSTRSVASRISSLDIWGKWKEFLGTVGVSIIMSPASIWFVSRLRIRKSLFFGGRSFRGFIWENWVFKWDWMIYTRRFMPFDNWKKSLLQHAFSIFARKKSFLAFLILWLYFFFSSLIFALLMIETLMDNFYSWRASLQERSHQGLPLPWPCERCAAPE